MALQGSGQITLAQIRDEFAAGTTSNVNLRTLSAAAGLSQPDQFSDFYGLSDYTPPSYTSGANSISGQGTAASPYVVSPTFAASSWTGDSCDYFSYTYNRCMYIETANCAQPEEEFKSFFIQNASSVYNSGIGGLKFSNKFAGPQKANVKFVSANINLNSQGYTGFFWSSSDAGFNYNVQNPTGNVWTSTVSNTTVSGNNFTRSIDERITFSGGFTQWSLEANAYGSAACADTSNESLWEVYFDVPSANYKISLSNLSMQIWFEPI